MHHLYLRATIFGASIRPDPSLLQIILKLRREGSNALIAAPISSVDRLPERELLGRGSGIPSASSTAVVAEDGNGQDGNDRKPDRHRDAAPWQDDGRDNVDGGDVNDTDTDTDTESTAPGQEADEDEGVPRASLDFENLFDSPQPVAAERGRSIGGGKESVD